MVGLNKSWLPAICLFLSQNISGQAVYEGKILDSLTNQPIEGASVRCVSNGCSCACSADGQGNYLLRCAMKDSLEISSIGYFPKIIPRSDHQTIHLSPAALSLQEVVLTAGRGAPIRRIEAPIAISLISTKTIEDAKPSSIEQVLNKVSGVYMVSHGNEQHQMSIRQPMTTKSLFLYLQDGIPIRSSGLFNHNALLEINMAAVQRIEVIKGPSSALYGSEAIGGVVNFISTAPTEKPLAKFSLQGNNIGYRRADFNGAVKKGRWGFGLSGYFAQKRNGFLEYSDFEKSIVTARMDYQFSDRLSITNSLTWLNYYSDMSGGIDSTMFARRSFRNLHSFTYRKVQGYRIQSTLRQQWNEAAQTSLTILLRENAIGQNPAYRVRDDYRRVNGVFRGQKDLAHGEINESSFNSYGLVAQHRQKLAWKKSEIIAGLSTEISPSAYDARYISIDKDSISNRYLRYRNSDSLLTDYTTALVNYAAFLNYSMHLTESLRLVASLRYDYFHYNFQNALTPSAFSGSPDTISNFGRFSPKIGFTYNFNPRAGLYANYSEGFVPPQVTELYTGVDVPELAPARFFNYELGGWAELISQKLFADISIYSLAGTNEIISVKLDDGSFANQNAGKTLHRGVEFGLRARPLRDLELKINGAYSEHRFIDFVEKGISYNNNRMNNAPAWLYNIDGWYKPSWLEGLRLGVEWQHVGEYFTDAANTNRYSGYDLFNFRIGYSRKGIDCWINLMNLSDRYYATIASKSAFGYSYQLGEPRNITIGIAYNFAELFKKNP